MSDEHVVEQGQRMAAEIRPILAGQHPIAQSIALADLLATYIAGHHPDLRDEALTRHIDLVPLNEREIFGGQGWSVQ